MAEFTFFGQNIAQARPAANPDNFHVSGAAYSENGRFCRIFAQFLFQNFEYRFHKAIVGRAGKVNDNFAREVAQADLSGNFHSGLAVQTGNVSVAAIIAAVYVNRRAGARFFNNNAAAARRVASHFLRENYSQFAYIGLTELDNAQDPRFAGFREGLARQGKSLPADHVLLVDPEEAQTANDAIAAFLQALPKPVAIFCFHDLIATMVLQACQKLKLPCPKAVAVAGFDNLPVSAMTTPPLTTVGYRISDMAETAVRLIIRQIETGKDQDANFYLEPSLVVRESSSKLAVVQFQSYHTRDILYKAQE